MKFNKENKKWVLTLGLLVVLGFNLSVHFSPKSGPEYAQLGATQEQLEPVMLAKKQTEGFADLSQISPPAPPVQTAAPKVNVVVSPEEKKADKKNTEGAVDQSIRSRTTHDARFGSGKSGEDTVIFERLEDGTTRAKHFKCKNEIKTECVECNKAITNLNIEFTRDLFDLSTALSAAVSDCNQSDKKAEDKIVKSKEDLAKEEHKDDFKKLAEKCNKEKKQAEKLECSIDGLTDLLKKPGFIYEENEVKSFFSKYIKTPLQTELSSSNSSSSNVWGIGDIGGASIYEFQQKLSSLTDKMKEMQDEILPDYSYLRKEIANISIRAIADKTLEINSYTNARNPTGAMTATNELSLMARMLPSANKVGLLAAVDSGFINRRYANNLFGSIEQYGNFSINKLADISNMNPLAANELMRLSLMGMDSWDYQRSTFDPIGFSRNAGRLGYDRFDRLSLASNLYDRDFSGDYRGNSFDSSFRRGFFGRDYSRPFSDRSGLRQSRRGTGRGSGIFSDGRSSSGIFTDSFNRGFNDNSRLGILGARTSLDSFDRGLNIRRDGSRLIQRGSNLDF